MKNPPSPFTSPFAFAFTFASPFAFAFTFALPFAFTSIFLFPSLLPAQSVNPFIGTGGHGHTYPGATVPRGMVQLSPDTGDSGWDWCSGYNFIDSSIMGFSHTHLSGTGISDLADILIMPYLGKPRLTPGTKEAAEGPGYRSPFSHDTEIAEPGYYAVTLEQHGIRAEMTADAQTGYHRYTFPDSDSATITIDLQHGLDRHRTWLTERVLDSELRVLDSVTLAGYRYSSGWANVQRLYFLIRLSQPLSGFGMATNGVYRPGSTLGRGRNVQGILHFSTTADTPLDISVSLSTDPFSPEFFSPDLSLVDFDTVRESAREEWKNELSDIVVEAPDSIKTIFYTALYHASLAPNRLWNTDGVTELTVFSQWDGYRAAFALNTLINPDIVEEMLETMLFEYWRNGYLPVWKLWQDEVNCMIGTPSVPIVVEALRKGYGEDLADQLYQAIHTSLTVDNPVAPWTFFDRYGYVPNDVGELFSVSKTLEMAYANGCAVQLARDRGDLEQVAFYAKRANAFRQLFDREIGFFRGRDRAGELSADFDPTVTNEAEFVEATPWQYLFHVQHDISALLDLHGGKKGLEQKLDALFDAGPATIDEHILDITGLIGQYAHGNEPSHHVAYLYNYVGRPDKTRALVHEIGHRFYTAQPDGLCGNEDAGQLSAWYVFSALGFYPVHPASGYYDLGIPLVESARLSLPDNRYFEVSTLNYAPEKTRIKSIRLNGKEVPQLRIHHRDIMAGGTLEFEFE